jgi:hypothetical protein
MREISVTLDLHVVFDAALIVGNAYLGITVHNNALLVKVKVLCVSSLVHHSYIKINNQSWEEEMHVITVRPGNNHVNMKRNTQMNGITMYLVLIAREMGNAAGHSSTSVACGPIQAKLGF